MSRYNIIKLDIPGNVPCYNNIQGSVSKIYHYKGDMLEKVSREHCQESV